jgi:putative transcriptional regulator
VSGKKPNPFFERLKAGLEEGLAHAKGELTLRTVEHPEPPPEIDAETLVALRTEAAMSQAVFAKMLSTSTKTVQSWEQGVRVPSMAARRLIQVFVVEPDALCRVVGLPTVRLSQFTVASPRQGTRRIVFNRPGKKVKA